MVKLTDQQCPVLDRELLLEKMQEPDPSNSGMNKASRKAATFSQAKSTPLADPGAQKYPATVALDSDSNDRQHRHESVGKLVENDAVFPGDTKPPGTMKKVRRP